VEPQKQKNPALAAIGSFFFPGLGQVYNGEGFLKGLLFFIVTLIAYLFFIIPGLIVHIYLIYNAYSTAKKMNEGTIPYKETTESNIILFIVIGIVIWIIYFIVVTIIVAAIVAAFLYMMVGTTNSY